MSPTFWTTEKEQQLINLVRQQLTFGQIQKAMQAPTRNTVLAKYWRMKRANPDLPDPRVSFRSKDYKCEGARVPHNQQIKKELVRSDLPVEVITNPNKIIPLMNELGEKITILNVTKAHCQFPIGDPANEDFQFCGHGRKQGSAYCDGHHAVCYVPVPKKEKKKGSVH